MNQKLEISIFQVCCNVLERFGYLNQQCNEHSTVTDTHCKAWMDTNSQACYGICITYTQKMNVPFIFPHHELWVKSHPFTLSEEEARAHANEQFKPCFFNG